MDLQGSFWTSGLAQTVGSQSASSIASILNDESQCSLQALLSDSDILQECRSGNSSLLDFLCKPEIILELVTLIVSGSSDPNSEDEKFAYVASEVVACEMAQITEAIVSSEAALSKLFSLVLCGDDRVDNRRAGHFRKVVAVLIQKKYQEIAEFLGRHPAIVSALISQIDNTSILEVIIMIGWDDGNPDNTNDRKWLFELKFIPSIVELFQSKYSELMHINASHALIDMVLKCPTTSTSLLLNHLTSPAVLNSLINNVISGSPSAFENGIGVLSVIVQRQAMINQDFDDEFFADDIPFPMTMILDKLPSIIELGTNSPRPDPIPSPMGGEIQPLGPCRLKLAELVLALLRTGIPKVQSALVESHLVPVLLSYFFEFKWNSILHFITENIAAAILTPKTSSALVKEFLQQGRFVPLAIDIYEENQKLWKLRKTQYSNVSHILRIMNMIVDLSVHQPDIIEWIHPDTAVWRTFVNDRLSAENERLTVQLGGFKPELEQQKSNGQNSPHTLPVDDEFIGSGETNFDSENNHVQNQAMFDMMNSSSSSTPFDSDVWPQISFDDQEFHVIEDNDIFGQISEFSSSNSEVVNPNGESESRSD